MWQIQLANYIMHLGEAHALIQQQGKTYVLERSLSELHPKALEELYENRVILSPPKPIDVFLIHLVEQHIFDDAGITAAPDLVHGQTVPDPHDPHGIRMIYRLPTNVKVHIWEPTTIATPNGQGWKVDGQGWVLIEVNVYEISIDGAKKMLAGLRGAEVMQQNLGQTGNRIWNQMTQARLPQFHGTEFFGGHQR